jgi:hypothetical protein
MTCATCGTNPVRPPWTMCWPCFSGKPVAVVVAPIQPVTVTGSNPRQQKAAPPGRAVCRHCQFAAVNRPRRLCWTCYYVPGVRERYVSTSKCARQGVGHRGRGLGESTAAMPGTEAKVAVLEARAATGLRLWHPADAKLF